MGEIIVKTLGSIDLPLPLFKRGKVRDVFDVGENLLIVSTDRISAFDYILPSLIPDKGRVLNRISTFFFKHTASSIPNHVVCAEPEKMDEFKRFAETIGGRSVLAKKLRVFPLEAIIRGYLVGSGWNSYQESGEICGVRLPPGLKFADRLPEPIFTPSTKAETGHDENITFGELANRIGAAEALRIKETSVRLFQEVGRFALEKGIIVADSKFEFGRDEDGRIVLADEIFTPDSSRFWKREEYAPGKEPPSFDKQFVRNYLLNSAWDRRSTPPPLPDEVIAKTREKYLEICRILTGNHP